MRTRLSRRRFLQLLGAASAGVIVPGCGDSSNGHKQSGSLDRVIVIGDTPHDVECARVAGARSIAVATGGYTVQQLREFGADEVLSDLSDTQAVLALLI